jgi:hypothetical protein
MRATAPAFGEYPKSERVDTAQRRRCFLDCPSLRELFFHLETVAKPLKLLERIFGRFFQMRVEIFG